MKIIITCSFERTRQIADFVPIKAYCEASAEFEIDDENVEKVGLENNVYVRSVSNELSNIAQSEVEKTLMGYTPACIQCGGKAIFPKKVLNKEGICAQCQSDNEIKARAFKKN